MIWSHEIFSQKLSRESGPGLTVLSSVLYSPTARQILLAAKESSVVQAKILVIEALENTLHQFIKLHPNSTISGLIPIPSRPKAIRSRGQDFLQLITQDLAEQFHIPMLPILGYSRRVKDQSGLNSKERWNNLSDSLVVRINSPKSENLRVLLIDDLVTTGATLLSAEKALNQAGIRAIGAVTACVAQPLRYGGGRAPF